MKKIFIVIILSIIIFPYSVLSKERTDRVVIASGDATGQNILNVCSFLQNYSNEVYSYQKDDAIVCYTSILTSLRTIIITNGLYPNQDYTCLERKILGNKTNGKHVSEIIDYIMVNKELRKYHLSRIIDLYLLKYYKYNFGDECKLDKE